MRSLAYEIGVLLGEMDANVKGGRDMAVGQQRVFMSRLMLLGRLAGNIEQELAVLRLCENGQNIANALEAAATDSLNHLVRDPEGKVITADFGRKP